MTLFTKKQTGDAGEGYCVRHLKKHGYRVLERNYRKPCGEIDVIAEKGGVLCFVEVKTRRFDSLTAPYEAVGNKKQRRLIRAAQVYLAETGWSGFCRFDVCEVITDPGTLRLLRLNYIENAFES